jgi:hypothetical protein
MSASRAITALLCTYDRPEFLSLALSYVRWQNASGLSAVVLDDSPRPFSAPRAVKYWWSKTKRPLSDKLNAAADIASSELLWKMDDDDYYGRNFLKTLARDYEDLTSLVFAQPFLIFDLRSWTVHLSDADRCSGATLLFSRECWRRHPFRGEVGVDAEFMRDHLSICGNATTLRGVDLGESFLQVRHGRHHMWTHMPDGTTLDEYVRARPQYDKPVEKIVPPAVAQAYAAIRARLVAGI